MWTQLVVAVIMMVVSAALTAMTAKTPTQTTPEAGKLDVPTAEEGVSVAVVFGTVVRKTSNIAWYGDASTQEIRSSGGGGKK